MTRVLVVEDTVTSAVHVCQILEEMGLAVKHVPDGEQALVEMTRWQPDIVLLDIMLPGMDGIDVARHIRQAEQGTESWTPIIFLTAKTDGEDLERAIESGGDDYLIKPPVPAALRAKLRAMQRIAQMRGNLLVLKDELDRANRELLLLSAQDGLTGIANRRMFDNRLRDEWQRAIREGSSVSLVLLDVDHFKHYNDEFGHQAGDECLRQVARVLASAGRRPGDVAARYGGEEFALILPNTSADGAMVVASAVCDAVRQLGIAHASAATYEMVTVSIGVSSMLPVPGDEARWQDLIQQADSCLYIAKQEGRDRVKRFAMHLGGDMVVPL